MKSLSISMTSLMGPLALVVALMPGVPGDQQVPGGPSIGRRAAPPELGPIEPIERALGGTPLKPHPGTDLTVTSFGLTADGRVTYVVANPGQTAANSPYVVDVYIAGKREDTVKHNPLPGDSQQRVISNLARPETCGPTSFRIAVDTQQLVTEQNETNNTQDRTITPPCPDLVVDIDKDSVSNGLKYRAKLQITNRGNLTTGRDFVVLLKGTSGGASPTNWFALPDLTQKRIGPLPPNETISFYDDEHLGVTRFHYRLVVDLFNEIRESNEDNNVKHESMGGGS